MIRGDEPFEAPRIGPAGDSRRAQRIGAAGSAPSSTVRLSIEIGRAPTAATYSAEDEIVRLVGDDARPPEINVVASDITLADVEEAMRDVVDPELGINVVDLGLVYGLNVEQSGAGTVALIDMTRRSSVPAW